MPTPEYSSPSALVLPQNIESLLATGLDYFRNSERSETRLYSMDGHPDLLVREHGTEEFLAEAKAGLMSVYSEADYLQYVLPSHLFVVNRNNYVVTAKVQGELLSDALRKPNAQLLEQTNGLYASIGRYLCGVMRGRGLVANDIYEPSQYMYGTIQNDLKSKIRLVDLPDGASDLNNPIFAEESYNLAVFHWANGLVETESIADTTMPDARSITADVLSLAPDTTQGKRWAEIFHLILTEKRTIYMDDPVMRDWWG